ncbi:hypothetical protein [Streptomyces sp. NBC_01800]|uniref:hypothetical protein n=1 Tax=Streptomyces sp. NBC_01800 TaxID=2975945 RepID=UPI002DDC1B5A|nr:hypothetical protein [Streptomyces sp. NBC_01800]WSA69255.1 hypothetical protein OIE65_21005 [Streptomyces sp. NBC_01800]
MHDTAYEITTQTPRPADYPAYLPVPEGRVMLPSEIPPGVQMVTLPGGIRTLARSWAGRPRRWRPGTSM